MANIIKEGLVSVSDTEVKLMEVEQVDRQYLKESKELFRIYGTRIAAKVHELFDK